MRITAYLWARRQPGRIALWLSLVVVILLAAGCGTGSVPASTPAATPLPTRAPQPTQLPTTATVTPDGPLTLLWWTPEFLSPKAAQPVGPLLADQIAKFVDAKQGKVRVTTVLKARYGKGGLLNFLVTAQPVAPSVLPDLVALDVSELEPAVAAGLLQPLENLLDENVIAGLYPFATSAGTFGEHLLAVQITADLEHLAYRPNLVETPPRNWQDLLDGGTSYLFTLGGPQLGVSSHPPGSLQPIIISQYLSAGANFDPAARQLTVEAEPLLRLLTFYDSAMKSGVLPPNALELADQDALWGIYSQGQVPLALVSARHYMTDQGGLKNGDFAPSPGWSGPAVPIADGWALAITTADPARQRAAADLIAWLLKPENAGSWMAAAGWLPTSPAALKSWGTSPYNDFLDQQLASAMSLPIGSDSAQAATRLEKALDAVLKGGTAPAAAVEAAVTPSK